MIDDASPLVLDMATPAAQTPTSALDAIIQQVISTRFDPTRSPLWGVIQIIQSGQGCHLMFCAHHIIIDDISLRLLFDELQQQRARLHAGNETSLPPPPLQHAGYAFWQCEWFQDTLLANEPAYWRACLRDALLLSTLPPLHPRPTQPSTHGPRLSITLGGTLSLALKRIVRTQGTAPLVLMLTVFRLVLMRYVQQQRLVIDMPVSGCIHPELQSSTGYYTSTAVIYTDFNGVEVGREALQRAKASVKKVQGRQQLPLENLVNMLNLPRSLFHSSSFQILYIYHNHVIPRVFTLAGTYWGQVTHHNQTVKYDMIVEVFQNDAASDVSFEYDLGLYDADVVKQIAEALRQHCLSPTSLPEASMGMIPLHASETAMPRHDPLNVIDVSWPGPQDVLRIIGQRYVQHSKQLAIQRYDGTLTYAELWVRVQFIMMRFRAHDIQPGDRIGVPLPRHEDVTATMLVTWFMGACYVSFDIHQPIARLQHLM